MENKKIARTHLDKNAHEILKVMTTKLKKENNDIKINRSILNSWLIDWFYKNHFSKQIKNITENHIDPIKQLQSLIKVYKSSDQLENINVVDLYRELNRVKSKLKTNVNSNASALPVVDKTTGR